MDVVENHQTNRQPASFLHFADEQHCGQETTEDEKRIYAQDCIDDQLEENIACPGDQIQWIAWIG